MATTDGRLPFADAGEPLDARIAARDQAARHRAVDPRFNVALEASAGTGKTRVLVDRYINLLRAGVDPANILAMTFTRKAAAEMRERIMTTLRLAAARGEVPSARWRELRDRTADIAISTIDAFCLSLLREFPLEADVDPGFTVADDTQLPRLVDESLDRALRICRAVAREDEDVALVFAQLGERRARAGLAVLLERRLVAADVLAAHLASGPAVTGVIAATRAASALLDVLHSMRGGVERFAGTGPLVPAFHLLRRGLAQLQQSQHAESVDPAAVQAVFTRARDYFLTQDGKPRSRSVHPQRSFANAADWRTHTALVIEHAAAVSRAHAVYRRDLNVLLSRGIRRMFRIADAEYRRTLDAHAVLDFSDLLLRALDLLRRMEEFSRSRFRLESRYHHVLVDEFQDTSRHQWELVSLLIQAWRQGAGVADGPLQPSIFIVGDRKQSIYGFRDADVSMLREAARHIEALRPDRDVRRAISRSFRSVPSLLAFVNDVAGDMEKASGDQAFEYGESDRFPIEANPGEQEEEALGLVVAETFDECADSAAAEVGRLLTSGVQVRDRDTGLTRPVRPGDIAMLFRSRESHRDFEAALTRRGIRTYVYKGLGFFDADEIKDVMAVVRYLADPESNLRAAALMRSRFFGISDEALRLLAPGISAALTESVPAAVSSLDPVDTRALTEARESTARWRALVDRLPAAELIDAVLIDSAYAFELRGPRFDQARENLKKMRGLLRRLQNRGYQTLGRVAAHLDRLAVGDEANAVIDALDAVHLMTVHASKGLEFPVVVLVNLARGTGNRRDPVRWSPAAVGEDAGMAVGERQDEVDEARDLREREETKRLLYVALTRARDRLYLATTLKEGRMAPARGSLGEVLPASLIQQLSSAANGFVEWRASSGAAHRFRVCALPMMGSGIGDQGSERPIPNPRSPIPDPQSPLPDFDPLIALPPPRPVAALVDSRGAPTPVETAPAPADDSTRLVGTIVHRLLQRFGLGCADQQRLRETAVRMLRPEEIAALGAILTRDEAADEAVAAYRAFCHNDDVRSLYEAGEALHEVPFSMHTDEGIVRGTIDCLIHRRDRVTVLEFKTGRPRDEHRIQLDLYHRAAARVFPGASVEARVVYSAPSCEKLPSKRPISAHLAQLDD